MPDTHDDAPPVACTLTPEQVAERTADLAVLADGFRGAEPLDDGHRLRFDGDDAVLEAVAAFVTGERACCAFATYRLETAPPHEEMRLDITGPEGTTTMFGDGLVELLTAVGG